MGVEVTDQRSLISVELWAGLQTCLQLRWGRSFQTSWSKHTRGPCLNRPPTPRTCPHPLLVSTTFTIKRLYHNIISLTCLIPHLFSRSDKLVFAKSSVAHPANNLVTLGTLFLHNWVTTLPNDIGVPLRTGVKPGVFFNT